MLTPTVIVIMSATARDLRANIAPRNHTAATASTSSTDTTTTTNNTNIILRRGIGFSSYRLITHPRPAGGYVVDGREGDYAISRGLGRFSVQSNVAVDKDLRSAPDCTHFLLPPHKKYHQSPRDGVRDATTTRLDRCWIQCILPRIQHKKRRNGDVTTGFITRVSDHCCCDGRAPDMVCCPPPPSCLLTKQLLLLLLPMYFMSSLILLFR